jgi:hypothetical protein
MYFDRFDIVEAYYVFFVNYHEGQWSEKYRRQCKMQSYFKPSLSVQNGKLDGNALEIYNALVENEMGADFKEVD